MPIYEFVCMNCETEFERILSFSNTSIPDCPSCEGSQVRRQVGRPAIHFKGSGWYITDSKKDAKKSGARESQNGSDESTSETKSETGKTDAKADAGTNESSKSETGKSTASASTTTTKSDS